MRILAIPFLIAGLWLSHGTAEGKYEQVWYERPLTLSQARDLVPYALPVADRWLQFREIKRCAQPYVKFEQTPKNWYGFADLDGCGVGLNQNYRWTWGELCSVMMHEYGHLAGLAHDPNEWAVMYQSTWRTFKPCRTKRVKRKILRYL